MSVSAIVMHDLDRRRDWRALWLSSLALGLAFALGGSVQYAFVLRVEPLSFDGGALSAPMDFLLRFTINSITVLVAAALAATLLSVQRSALATLLLVPAIAFCAGMIRTLMQFALGVHTWDELSRAIGDGVVAWCAAVFVVAMALTLTQYGRGTRSAERERMVATRRAADALQDLQQEELRVRRDVADALHGTVQHRFVMLGAEVSEIAATVQGDPARRLATVARELDDLREHELRQLSATLYPESLERGLVPAARALISRIPPSIAVEFVIENVATPDELDSTTRLLLTRVIEEGVSNALRHGHARRLTLRVSADRSEYLVELRHHGLELQGESVLSGLARLRDRLAVRGGSLALLPAPQGALLRAQACAANVPSGTRRSR